MPITLTQYRKPENKDFLADAFEHIFRTDNNVNPNAARTGKKLDRSEIRNFARLAVEILTNRKNSDLERFHASR